MCIDDKNIGNEDKHLDIKVYCKRKTLSEEIVKNFMFRRVRRPLLMKVEYK